MAEGTTADPRAQQFEAARPHLRAVAHRVLGSPDEAEDAVQETWVRLSRTDTSEVTNLTGWLTTVVSRVCLDMLRARAARREEPAELPEATPDDGRGPEGEAVLADAIGPALLLVLDTLTPAERLAFVLHDMFAVPFPEIAEIIGGTPAAARQLASRGRRRVRGGGTDQGGGDPARRRAVVEAFLRASRDGDFAALVAMLHPDVKLRADAAGVRMGSPAVVAGADAVAATFDGRARHARLAVIDGEPGLAWFAGGELRVVFRFTVTGGTVTAIDLVADPETLAGLEVAG